MDLSYVNIYYDYIKKKITDNLPIDLKKYFDNSYINIIDEIELTNIVKQEEIILDDYILV
jgi:hypothetical protein